MTEFRYMSGLVYILENTEAKLVKVGMTINDVRDRLQDVNEKWLGLKATCQICGGRRLVNSYGYIPTHPLSGEHCRGSGSLPFERDSALAKLYLKEMKKSLGEISGIQLNSITRKISTIEKRMELFQKFGQLVGEWKISTVYYTTRAEHVELRSHEILSMRLDNTVPIGEVFNCSVLEAVNAVESALKQLDLLNSSRKEVMNN